MLLVWLASCITFAKEMFTIKSEHCRWFYPASIQCSS